LFLDNLKHGGPKIFCEEMQKLISEKLNALRQGGSSQKTKENRLGIDFENLIMKEEITKIDMDAMREQIVLNCPEEEHPLRRRARAIMVHFQNVPDDTPVDNQTARKLLKLMEESFDPQNHSKKHEIEP
jgi:hypothetical protein